MYIYNKTSIKRNILTIKKINREVGRAKDLSVPRYYLILRGEKNVMYVKSNHSVNNNNSSNSV